jgi:hypothetical protein
VAIPLSLAPVALLAAVVNKRPLERRDTNARGRRVPRKVRSARGRLSLARNQAGARAAGGKPN